MFCPKCGAQIEDNSVYCAKCGEKLSEQQGTNTVVVVQNSVNSKSLFNTAFIINVLSFAIPFILILCSNIIAAFGGTQLDASDDSSGVTVSFDYGNLLNGNLIATVLIVGVLIFIFGIVIFILRKLKKNMDFKFGKKDK